MSILEINTIKVFIRPPPQRSLLNIDFHFTIVVRSLLYEQQNNHVVSFIKLQLDVRGQSMAP